MKARQGYKLVTIGYRKFEEIPEDWDVKKINELCKLAAGSVFPEKYQEGCVGEIPFCKVNDLNFPENYDYVLKTENSITKETVKSVKAKIRPHNTIIFPKIGQTIYTRKLAILTKESCFDNNLMGLVSKNIPYKFLYYSIDSIHVENFVQITALPYLDNKIIANIKIAIPKESDEADKIASIISNVDAQLQQTQKLIDLTQRLKKGLMQNLLTRGIGHTKFKKINYIFKKQKSIPENWNLDIVENVCEKIVVGFVGTIDPFYTSEKGVLLIRTNNIMEGELDLTGVKYVTKEFHDKNKKSQIKNNDLLVARHGTNGEACLVKNIKEANCLNIVLMRPDTKKINSSFLEYFFNCDFTRKQIIRLTAGGVQNVVNTKELAKIKILGPPLEEQQQIASVLSNVDEQINQHKNEKALLERIKKGLMQQLLTGQRRVKVGV